MHSYLILILVFTVAVPRIEGVGGLRGLVQSTWKKFWSVSCDYSSLISRSKRSIDIPQPTDDAEAFFDYLYPSAGIKIEDARFEARFSGSSLSTWLDGVIDVWHTECERRMMQAADDEFKPTMPTPSVRNASSVKHTSSARPTSSERPVSSLRPALHGNSSDSEDYDDGFNATDYRESPIRTDRQGAGSLGSFLGLPALPTPIPLPTPRPLALKKENKFFAQFGGDIEYFFPLIGYGIPFDGEITVLGFHGFKGLFPYRR